MKISIRYFSGTGNTWRIAASCVSAFEAAGCQTDFASILRGGPPDPAADSAGFYFPVYSLDLPRIAVSFLRELPRPEKTIPALLMITGGSADNCGWAVDSGVRLLSEKGYDVRIGDLIQMPDNWAPFHSAPDPERSAVLVDQGVAKAETLAQQFLGGERRIKPISLRRFGPVGSALMRVLFHRRGINKIWSFFRVNDRCTGCGICARACPTGSIILRDGKPVWSATCEQCMRCFSYCPRRAIQQFEGLLHGSRHRVNRLPGFNPSVDSWADLKPAARG